MNSRIAKLEGIKEREVESELPVKQKDGIEYIQFETDNQKIRYERKMREEEIKKGENDVAQACWVNLTMFEAKFP